jgi:hypothetical protein
MRRWALQAGFLLFAIAITNFLAFQSITLAIHGDAENGKVVNDRYYVQYKGDYTEVSQGTFHYSYYHGVVNKITFGLGVIGLVIILPSNESLKAATARCKGVVVVCCVGAFLGLAFGALLAIGVPLLLETQRWRSIWWDVPLFILLGAAIAGGVHLVWIAGMEKP